MLKFITRKIRQARAVRYVRAFPEDLPAAQAVLAALEFGAANAREAAEMLAGRPLSDSEWSGVSAQWERTWWGVK